MALFGRAERLRRYELAIKDFTRVAFVRGERDLLFGSSSTESRLLGSRRRGDVASRRVAIPFGRLGLGASLSLDGSGLSRLPGVADAGPPQGLRRTNRERPAGHANGHRTRDTQATSHLLRVRVVRGAHLWPCEDPTLGLPRNG